MEFYNVIRFPSMPRRLLILIVTAYCVASLLPCSVSFDDQYETCQSRSTCGNINIKYPFGVGNNGCGLPSFQIDCVQNSDPVIILDGLKYTILSFHYNKEYFVIVRDDNCHFLDQHFNISSEYADGIFKIKGKANWDVIMYNCNPHVFYFKGGGPGQLSKCNDSAYYALYDNGSSIQGCSKGQVTVDVGIMEWVSNDRNRDKGCKSCEASGGICGYRSLESTVAAPFVCYCKDGPRTDNCNHGMNIGALLGGLIGVAVFIAAGLLVGRTLYRRKSLCFRKILVLTAHRDDEDKDIEAAIQDKIGTLPVFSYEILKQATNDFDEKNQLGDGGFGSVYLGKLRDGRAVAVKTLYQDNSRRVEQFINEVQILSTNYHPNLVRLYGCSSPQSRDLLLVYEYVSNGTLADHLHGERNKEKCLNWNTRLKICIETAQALAFLHCLEPPIFHRDVKSPNILLDEDLHVKVADFGLSRFVPLDVTHVSTAPQGTPGYVDPEYHRCFQLTDKSDVYSFGVVLMELVSGMLAVDITRSKGEILLADMAIAKIQGGTLHELIDQNLDIGSNPDIKAMVTAVAKLAFRCLAPQKEDRPDMKEVVAELEQIKQNGRRCKHPAFHPLSPDSVQESWLSTSTTPENSPDMKEVVAEIEQIKQNGRKCKHSAFHPQSPDSVQGNWPSTSTTPENSPSLIQSCS